MGLTNQEICSLNREFICHDSEGHLCFSMPPKNHISRFLIIPDDIGTLLDRYIDAENIQSGAILLKMRLPLIQELLENG